MYTPRKKVETVPTLVILAAGMGHRYGGLKQIDPVGPAGEVIMDYSVYDALTAGFSEVVIIITHEMEDDFRRIVGDRIAEHVKLTYAFQELGDLPAGYCVPAGRTKPWGTAQAVLAAKDCVHGPFAVINADDFYGRGAITSICDFLTRQQSSDGVEHLAMVGYSVENTITDHGPVARGVCEVDTGDHLIRITERTRVEKDPDPRSGAARYTPDDGRTWVDLPADTIVSMNLWGFTQAYMAWAEDGFRAFLDQTLPSDPLGCEFYLPTVVEQMMESGSADVTVVRSPERWHGVTYRQDRPDVVQALAAKHAAGHYPTPLWGNA